MKHEHAPGHDHSHAHGSAPPRSAGDAPSVLMSGAPARMAAAMLAIVLLWAAVAWALADLVAP